MAITEQLFRLGQSARRLNDGSDRLDRSLAEIDRALSRLMLGFEFRLPQPIAELERLDRSGKRVIDLSYLGYFRFESVSGASDASPRFHLGVRTLRVLEGKRSGSEEQPGKLVPLLEAPREIRHAAVDQLPELVAGLAAAVEELVENIERRCEVASSVLDDLDAAKRGG